MSKKYAKLVGWNLFFLSFFVPYFFDSTAYSAVYFADNSLTSACTSGSYSISNRNCNGSDGKAYTTIQSAVNSARTPGDIVYVRQGVYPERIITVAAGSVLGLISIQTYNNENVVISHSTHGGFQINHAYIKIKGFDISGSCNSGSAYIYINRGLDSVNIGNNCYIENNKIHDGSKSAAGIYIKEAGTPYYSASNCNIKSNKFSRLNYVYLALYGSNHVVEGNLIEGYGNAGARNANDYDAFWVLGEGTVIRNNEVKNLDGSCNDSCASPCSTGCGRNHTDFIQTAGDCGIGCDKSMNIIVERNYVHDLKTVQIAQLSSDGQANVRDWVFRNNLFANVGLKLNIYMPGVKIYNNTFYLVEDQANGGNGQSPVQFGSGSGGTALNGEVKNNLFVGNGSNISSTGWYLVCSSCTGFTANHNYVTGRPPDYPFKMGFSELNGINGGNPKFENISNYNFHLQADSPAKGLAIPIGSFNNDKDGKTRGSSWDIGAHNFGTSLAIPGNLMISIK